MDEMIDEMKCKDVSDETLEAFKHKTMFTHIPCRLHVIQLIFMAAGINDYTE